MIVSIVGLLVIPFPSVYPSISYQYYCREKGLFKVSASYCTNQTAAEKYKGLVFTMFVRQIVLLPVSAIR